MDKGTHFRVPVFVWLCVIAARASPALLGDSMAMCCMEDPGSDAQANDSIDFTSGSQLTLLQLSTDISHHRAMANDAPHLVDGPAIFSSIEHWSGGATGWLGRFPKLEAAENHTTHAERCVQIWKALGENTWMEFIDGRAHAGGPHVFDDATDPHPGRASGSQTFENQDIIYDEFSTVDAWKSRLTVSKLAQLNARYRGLQCLQPSCPNMFDRYGTSVDLNASEKESKLIHILAEYHDAIDAIRGPTSDTGGSTHIQRALPYIVRLYHKLALLHPFSDGNSRTRSMVLQTELVRQGGHPAVLWDNYWGIYQVAPLTPEEKLRMLSSPGMDTYGPHSAVGVQLQEFVLDGWCGWEIVYNTKDSPFLPFVNFNGTLLSTPHAEYDAATGACEEGPGRSYWSAAFDKNHPEESYEEIQMNPEENYATAKIGL